MVETQNLQFRFPEGIPPVLHQTLDLLVIILKGNPDENLAYVVQQRGRGYFFRIAEIQDPADSS